MDYIELIYQQDQFHILLYMLEKRFLIFHLLLWENYKKKNKRDQRKPKQKKKNTYKTLLKSGREFNSGQSVIFGDPKVLITNANCSISVFP